MDCPPKKKKNDRCIEVVVLKRWPLVEVQL